MNQQARQQRERDITAVSKLYLQGKKQVEIAELLDIHQGTVSRYLKIVRQRWLKESVRDFDAARAEELAKIDRMEVEYWEAWEHSCKGTKNGDPRYLQGIQWCIDRRIKLLGFDAPQMLEHQAVEFDVNDWRTRRQQRIADLAKPETEDDAVS